MSWCWRLGAPAGRWRCRSGWCRCSWGRYRLGCAALIEQVVAAVVDAGRDPAEKRVRGVGLPGSPRSILILIRRCPAIRRPSSPLFVESPRAELFSILPAGQG